MIEPSIWKSNIFGFHHKINEHLHSEGVKPYKDQDYGNVIYELTVTNAIKILVFADKLVVCFDEETRHLFLFDRRSYESFVTAYSKVIWLIEEKTE